MSAIFNVKSQENNKTMSEIGLKVDKNNWGQHHCQVLYSSVYILDEAGYKQSCISYQNLLHKNPKDKHNKVSELFLKKHMSEPHNTMVNCGCARGKGLNIVRASERHFWFHFQQKDCSAQTKNWIKSAEIRNKFCFKLIQSRELFVTKARKSPTQKNPRILAELTEYKQQGRIINVCDTEKRLGNISKW